MTLAAKWRSRRWAFYKSSYRRRWVPKHREHAPAFLSPCPPAWQKHKEQLNRLFKISKTKLYVDHVSLERAVFVVSVFMTSWSPRKLSISHLWQSDFFVCLLVISHWQCSPIRSICLVARCPCTASGLPPPPDTTPEYASTISKSTLCEAEWDQPTPSLATRVTAWRW